MAFHRDDNDTRQIYENLIQFSEKNGPSCVLYSNDGYKIDVNKEVLIQTSFLRSLMKTTCCIADHRIEIFLPFIQYDVLEIIANFLYTGELISDTKETLELAVHVLVEDLGFPSGIYVNNASNDLGDDHDNLETRNDVDSKDNQNMNNDNQDFDMKEKLE